MKSGVLKTGKAGMQEAEDEAIYRMVGKFGGNLIWQIGLRFHLADFNLAVLFLRAMMSYVIAT